MKKLVAKVLMLGLMLLVGGCSESAPELTLSAIPEPVLEPVEDVASQTDFQSPEAVVRVFLEGLRERSYACMVATFPDEPLAVNEYVRAAIEAGAVLETTEEEIAHFILVLEGLTEYYQIPLEPSLFHSLEIIGFISPEAIFNSELFDFEPEVVRNLLENQAEEMDAEQLVSNIALFTLEGEHFVLFLEVADFDGDWRITRLGGTLYFFIGGFPGMRGVIPPEIADELLEELDLETWPLYYE